MADILDFLPLRREDIATVRARLDADANAGIAPDDSRYIDTTPGGFYWDLTQPGAMEMERLWDFIATEVAAAVFPRFAWGEYLDEHGETLDLPRKAGEVATGTVRFTGTNGTFVSTGTQVAVPTSDPDDEPLIFETIESGIVSGGFVDLSVSSEEAGGSYNTGPDTITLLISPVEGIASVTNPAAIAGGADVEADDAYQQRILLEYASTGGSGTVSDYRRWALAYPGVGFVTVEPVWNGPGTVRVIITDTTNNPVAGSLVTGLQTQLDPSPGLGSGLAPIGAVVTVATPSVVTVTVAATPSFRPGYSLDGAGGTIPTRDDLEAAIAEYVNSLPPGEDVILNHVEAVMFDVEGVFDVTGTQLNGLASNVTVTALQVAQAGTITLS